MDLEALANSNKTLAEKIADPIFEGLAAVGLNTPSQRILFGLAAGSGISYVIKPSFQFNKDGSPRPWSLISQDKTATSFPFWASGVVAALVLGVFI